MYLYLHPIWYLSSIMMMIPQDQTDATYCHRYLQKDNKKIETHLRLIILHQMFSIVEPYFLYSDEEAEFP